MELYGKEESQFETVLEFFLSFVGRYTPAEVFQALEKYIRLRSRFPAPSDLIGLIEGRIKRDPAYYGALKDKLKRGQTLTPEQSLYVKEYEKQTLEDFE